MAAVRMLTFDKVGLRTYGAWWLRHRFVVQPTGRADVSVKWFLAVDGVVVGRFATERDAMAAARIRIQTMKA